MFSEKKYRFGNNGYVKIVSTEVVIDTILTCFFTSVFCYFWSVLGQKLGLGTVSAGLLETKRWRLECRNVDFCSLLCHFFIKIRSYEIGNLWEFECYAAGFRKLFRTQKCTRSRKLVCAYLTQKNKRISKFERTDFKIWVRALCKMSALIYCK